MKKNFTQFAARFRSYVFAFAMLFTLTTMTSCDEDCMIAYDLEGTWEGNMYQTYDYNGVTYAPSYTEVTFSRSPYRYSSGEGYWVDYFSGYTPWQQKYNANHIYWTVQDGVIRIDLFEDNVTFYISDYRLSNSYFTGTLESSDYSYGQFRLRHVSSPNWNDYTYGWDPYYYAPQRGNINDSTTNDVPQQSHPVRVMKK